MTFSLLGIFGGTFDPIHKAHLLIINKLANKLPFKEIQLIPCGYPPHRNSPVASPEDRVEMIKRAIVHIPHLKINEIEAKREGFSYTIDTLKSLRVSFPRQSLCFIMATDELLRFNQWYHYQAILRYCHLIIVNRPNYPLSKKKWLNELLLQHQTNKEEDLSYIQSGKIIIKHLSPSKISATEIRYFLREGDDTAVKQLLPAQVFDYVKGKHLYLY
ncbi:nicotinate-nucleotide adenylyltransferase [Coxiella endosymbiont of Amblyomma nuttalli]|uniref:nicotinate-nucleotide adenylyltransferase n=1 Tax=Coxiella endosymbiont of Amblyomma nuttalli TaxID=2749996 RepID=UPI001BA6F909|nr:nicotinate-nucleotide adenylyltransferase [Coxiella endosymbiont of Amblyomma nuttalli]QTS83885.1 Nicotinate-nucleotide adenylyltransferase [Coxiella endosymbiont of Amblyomma nuttalli]